MNVKGIQLKNLFKLLISCQLMLMQIKQVLTQSQTRIVGGTPTTIDKAPYLVQIISEGSILCGGTLVSERFVVTAAHCFDKNPGRLLIVGGASRLTDNGIRSRVSKIIIPTSYNRKIYDVDVAVIKLRTPLRGDSVQTTNLCQDDWNTGDPVKLYGWGKRVEDADNIPIQLHTVAVNVTDRKWCEDTYRSRHPLTDTMFCANAHGKDACSGDSGGPVMVNDQFCGIVSWGVGCARADSPGVYTSVKKVSKFLAKALLT